MKNCSYCGRENDETATVCRECGSDFQRPEAKSEDEKHLKDPDESLVTIAAFDDFNEANLLKSRLEGAGFEVCIPEEFGLNIFSINRPVIERFTVCVASKDVAAAKELLADSGGAATSQA